MFGILMMRRNWQMQNRTEYVDFILNLQTLRGTSKENFLEFHLNEKFYRKVSRIKKWTIKYVAYVFLEYGVPYKLGFLWIKTIFNVLCILGSVPSVEKQDRPKIPTRPKPRTRAYFTTGSYSNREIYVESGIEGRVASYESPHIITKQNSKVFRTYHCY